MRYASILAILLLATVPAIAADVYECGFENDEGYILDYLDGQQEWSADVDVYIQSGNVASGQQAMTIETDSVFDYAFHWSAGRTFPDHRPLGNVVIFSQAIFISTLDEADWLIQFCDFDEELVTNYIHFTFEGYIDFNDTIVGTFLPASWMILTVTMDFDTQTVTVSLDDDMLVEDAPFYSPAAKFDQVIYATDDYAYSQISYMDIDDLFIFTPAGPPSFY
ncbi:MAG: hypothetical protein JXL80_12690, partial [Planctomycetes bacterium]|nr:hypothetical protein [Planctomycetota bacterium]